VKGPIGSLCAVMHVVQSMKAR